MNGTPVRSRRAILILAAVVVAVAVLVPLLRSRPEVPAGLRGAIVSIDFADRSHGYAVLGDCDPTKPVRPGCGWRIDATRDGVTWLPRTTPQLTDAPDIVVDVLGKDTVVLTQGGVRWFSKDEARTWDRLPTGLAAPVDSIPAGAKVFVGCSDWRAVSCTDQRVLVTVPETGAVAPLSHQPAMSLRLARAQPVPAADGSWWLMTHDEPSNKLMLAVSRDDGRTWTATTPLPSDQDGLGSWLSDVVSGPGGYFALGQMWPRAAEGVPTLAVYRSADGRGWEVTRLEARQDGAVLASPMVAPTGEVILSTPGHERPLLISRDGGRSFAPADGPQLDSVSWTRAGYLNATIGFPARYSLSQDGLTWRSLGE